MKTKEKNASKVEKENFEVLLVDPGIQLKTRSNVKYVNRGLLSIATYLKSKGVKVNYFPLDHYYMNKGMNDGEVMGELKKIIEEKDIKLSAISNLFIAETENTLKIAKFIKDNFPEVATVIGGYNPTIINQELIKKEEIDYIVKGEGEWALLDLVAAIQEGKSTREISGIVSKESDGMERKHGDLSEIPPLDYSILPHDYLLGENPPRINLELARGCYHNCSFCSVSRFWQQSRRDHNPEKIIQEFEQLKGMGYHGVISLEEAMVNFKKPEVKEFLRRSIPFKNDFEFDFITSRYDFLDDESLELIHEVGYKNLMLGLESASKTVLDKINKHIDLDQFVEACEMVKKHKEQHGESGIKLNIYMVVGLPGETKETGKETYDFLVKLMNEKLIDSVFPCHFQPYPGTLAKEQLKEVGGRQIVEGKDYFKWLMRDEPLVEYEGLDREALKEMMNEMMDLNKEVKNPVIENLR